MLKRRPRFARSRLPANPPSRADTGQRASRQRPVAWPSMLAPATPSLWLCISFIPLNTELKRFISSEKFRSELAEWALGYTSVVSIDPDGALLLEIGGSLRLFGGLQKLRLKIEATLHDRSLRAVLACAPTARAAGWLARAGLSVACTAMNEMPQLLGRIPVAALGWPARIQQRLQQMGVHTLAECRRLPRDGFARRIGRAYLQAIDEAFGLRPQPLQHYESPLFFNDRVELDDETFNAPVLLAATDVLLQRLQGFLRRHQAGTQTVSLWLEHNGYKPSVLQVRGGELSTQTGHLHALVALQLERFALTAPVVAVTVKARAFPEPVYASMALPGIESAAGIDPARQTQLLAKLQARLGHASVHGLQISVEHRPEKSWQVTDVMPAAVVKTARGAKPGATFMPQSVAQRPLWLLQAPQRIDAPAAAPLLRHAERIESGWWDGHDIRRDYYSVSGPSGSRWWVYRDCRDSHWYLHGLFG